MGYLGSYIDFGMSAPLIQQISDELRMRMPRVFCQHTLHQAWAYKYDDLLQSGIAVHADSAAVNVNFWITPSDANLDPNSGGLVVYKVKAPEELGMQKQTYI